MNTNDPNSQEFLERKRADTVREAKRYIADCEWMKTQVENNPEAAIEIRVSGQVIIGLTDRAENAAAINHLLDQQIHEAQKCINGEQNGFE